MAWNVAFSIAAAAAGLLGLKLVDPDPSFDFQVVTPQVGSGQVDSEQVGSGSNYTTEPTGAATQSSPMPYESQVRTRASGPSVSVSFHDARVGELLGWLEKQGISFMVADNQLKDRTITVNVKNQPLDTVVDALATALGGHWEHRGDIHIFKTGSNFYESLPGGMLVPSKDGKVRINGSGNSFSFSDGDPLSQQFKGFITPDSSTELKIFESPNVKGLGGKSFTLPKGGKGLGDLKGGFMPFIQPGGKSEGVGVFSFYGVTLAGAVDFAGFVKSLTDCQKELEKKQGYLKPDDLTAKQRQMIGIKEHQTGFELHYERDGQSIIVKSK